MALWSLLGSVPVVKYGPKPKTRAMRKLLGDFGFGGAAATGSGSRSEAEKYTAGKMDGGESPYSSSSSSSSRATSRKGNYISFWKPEVKTGGGGGGGHME